MSIFGRNPNEAAYVHGKKHWVDVIKNSGPGELLVWRQPEEDFNTNSTLIVFPSEEAVFFKGGIVEQVFSEGTFKLATDNYPVVSRFRNVLSGGISTFNCVVYFVRKAHSMEVMWGTDTPLQVRDPVLGIATSLQARGSYKVQIDDSAKFITKMFGANTRAVSQSDLQLYFRNEFQQYIKSGLAQAIRESNEEILGICAKQASLAEGISPSLAEPLCGYGIKLVSFSIAGLDIPQDDPNRQRLEAAYATRTEAQIYGPDYGRFVARELLSDIANNPGAGGLASASAGLGLGLGAAPVFGTMTQQVLAPMQSQQSAQTPAVPPTQPGRFVQKNSASQDGLCCPKCNSRHDAGSKFCSECGAKLPGGVVCPQCGASISETAKFCSLCGAKIP